MHVAHSYLKVPVSVDCRIFAPPPKKIHLVSLKELVKCSVSALYGAALVLATQSEAVLCQCVQCSALLMPVSRAPHGRNSLLPFAACGVQDPNCSVSQLLGAGL